MVTADNHKKVLENTLNTLLDVREWTDLEKIIKKTQLDIFSTLGDTLFIDSQGLTDIKSIWERVRAWVGVHKELDDQIVAITAAVSVPRDKNIAFRARIAGGLTTRDAEFNSANAIVDIARHFELNINDSNVVLPWGTTIDIWVAAAVNTENLNNKFTNWVVWWSSFDLYDENLSKFKKDSLWRYIISLPTKTWTKKDVAVEWLSFVSPSLRFNNIKLLDPDTTTDIRDQIDLSKEIVLPIWCTLNVGGKKIANQKMLKFKLRDPLAPMPLTDAQQRARYNLFNIGWMPINTYIQDFYDNNYKETEDKLLDEIIGDAISADNKKVLRDRIKRLNVPLASWIRLSPFIVNQLEINNNFREYFFANVKPTAEDKSSQSKYNDFLKNNIPAQLKIYTEKELKRQMESTANNPLLLVSPYNPATRTLHDSITNEILQYKQEQEDRAQDNFTDSNTLLTNTKINKKKRSPKLTRSWLFGIFGKKDVNNMRSFNWQSQETWKQKLNLQTDKDKNKVEFTWYEAKVNIWYVDNISVDITMDNWEELSLKAWNHIALIRSLLKNPDIPYGKMRMHIAYNIIKSIIKIVNKDNMTLEYSESNILNKLSIDKNDDIILEKIDDTTGVRVKTKLFSEKDFDGENDMHRLRLWLEQCLWHFNKSMELVHKQNKQATDKKLFSYFSLSRAKFPVGRIDSPIKKLMNLRKSRTLDFDFNDLAVPWVKGNVSISFSKNTYTITSDLLEKPISSKNLGELVRTRVKWKCIFAGMDRAIGWAIYKSTIENLRKNSKIANTNFGVKDPVKNRVYFIDTTWEIWYISLANNKNPINKSITKLFKNDYGVISKLPSTWRVILKKPEQQNEFYKNRYIMWKLMKAMNTRLYSF